MKAEEILEKHSDVKVSEILKSDGFKMPYGTGMATIHIKDKPLFRIEQVLMAMDEYAQQYKGALIRICEEKDKAKTTSDLFSVLQEIEKARIILIQSI